MSAMIEYTIRGQYPREGLGLTRLWRRLQGKPTFPKADVLMKAIKSAKTDVEVTGVEFDTALQAHLPRDVAAAFRFPRGIKVTDISITSDRGDRAEQILSWVLSARRAWVILRKRSKTASPVGSARKNLFGGITGRLRGCAGTSLDRRY
jgi:hypothetical protein